MNTTKIDQASWLDRLSLSLTDSSLTSPFGDLLPGFPSEELQRNTTGLAGRQALVQAHGFYADLCTILEESMNEIQPGWDLLDFGSCWGRISRLFMRDVPLANIHGLDIEKMFVDECRHLFRSEKFQICSPMPPSPVRNSSVDLIVAYSVFSHLSEGAFVAWVSEFHRILRSGGILAFTTRNKAFIDYCAALKGHVDSLAGYPKALASMLPDIVAAKRRYDSGELVFVTGQGLSGGGAMNDAFYGETFIPRAYVERAFVEMFEILNFKEIGEAYDQALFVLKKCEGS